MKCVIFVLCTMKQWSGTITQTIHCQEKKKLPLMLAVNKPLTQTQ